MKIKVHTGSTESRFFLNKRYVDVHVLSGQMCENLKNNIVKYERKSLKYYMKL